jgi:hypothetical protein
MAWHADGIQLLGIKNLMVHSETSTIQSTEYPNVTMEISGLRIAMGIIAPAARSTVLAQNISFS